MRMTAVVAVGALALVSCNKSDTSTPTATPSANPTGAATPPAGFTPPTTISRAEYGGRIERRFHKLDANDDGKLERSELPAQRAERLLRRMDKNGDGNISADEWSQGMLARFDTLDANRDGSLTSDERGKRSGGRRRQQAPAGGLEEGDEVDNGM